MEDEKNTFELVESRDALELVPRWEPQAWWYFVAAGLIVVLIFLCIFLKRKKGVHDPSRERREAYAAAKKEFDTMASNDIRDTAMKVSLVLRGYLARSLQEPALFETHEEFIGRHDGLKNLPEEIGSEVGSFFSRLAALKYAPLEATDESSMELRDSGKDILERIHKA